MRVAALVLVVLLLPASPAQADEWTATDTAIQATVLTLIAADYVQTRQIVADGRESNPIMGRRGDRIPPGMYFLSLATMHTFAAVLLPVRHRRLAQGVMIGVQLHSSVMNLEAGYSFRW